MEISQIIKLGYQDYLNSNGQIDNVVVTVEQRTSGQAIDDSAIAFEGQPGWEIDYQNLESELNTQKSNNEINDNWTTPGELFPNI